MATWRKVYTYWTETKRVVGGKVIEVTCCCADPGGTRRTCMKWAGNKTPCRCHCHTVRNWEEGTGKIPPPKGNP